MDEHGRLQHFEIVRASDAGGFVELGRGAMGVTFRAMDTILKREVALKVINPGLLTQPSVRQRFLREARAAASLRHPNVATVLHLGEEGGTYFYVMELIEGETLDRCVQQSGPFESAAALDVALQVCRALAAAERHGLVHRDIKPSNIMLLEQDGERLVKVIDFGLAKFTGGDPGSTLGGMTTGSVLGTPHFASPEQLNEQAVDIRSDFYSLGATLWFMLRGRPPFSGPVARIIGQHLSAPFPLDELPELAAGVREVLEKLSAKKPEGRPQSTAELRRILEAARVGCDDPGRKSAGIAQTQVEEELVAGRFRKGGALGIREGLSAHEGTDFASGLEVILYEIPEDAEDFVGAARRIAENPHPNLLAVLSVNSPWMVRPRLEGVSLLDVLRARQRLPVGDAMLVLDAVGAALDHARGLGLGLGAVHPASAWLLPARPDSGERLAASPFDRWGGMDIVVDVLQAPPAHGSVTLLPGERGMDGWGNTEGSASPERGLAVLLAELLGEPEAAGKGRFVPLAALDEGANGILRMAFEKPGHFSSAAEFVKELAAACRTLLPGVAAQAAPTGGEGQTTVTVQSGSSAGVVEQSWTAGKEDSESSSMAGLGLVPLPPHLRERYNVRNGLSAFAPGQRRFRIVTRSEPPQAAVLIHCLYSTPLDAAEVRSLEDSARRMLTAPHPAFCRALDFAVSAHDSALVTEFPGEMTLHDVIARVGRLSYEHAVRVAGVLADACEAAVGAGWPQAPLETRSVFVLVQGHDIAAGMTVRVPCPGLPQSGREEIDPFATLAFAAPRPAAEPDDAAVYTPQLVELFCAMLGQPLRIHGRGGFRPVPELSAEQNARLRSVFEAAARRSPPLPSEVVRDLGGRPSSWRTTAGGHGFAGVAASSATATPGGERVSAVHDAPVAEGLKDATPVSATRLRLLPAQSGRWPVLALSAEPQFVLGRSPKDSDFLAAFMPRSVANDSRTMKIGRQQLRMDFHAGTVTLTDVGSTNSSRWNDRVPQGERMALREEEVALAGEYPVRLMQIAARPFRTLRVAGRETERSAGVAGCIAVAPAQGAAAYPCLGLWIFSEAAFRIDGRACAVLPAGDEGRDAEAFVLFVEGAFWIENAGLTGLKVAGADIPPKTCAPLRPGDSVCLGPVEYEVAGMK